MVERLAPVTRFSVAPEPLRKLTLPPEPMEKVFQLMIALPEDWVTVSPPVVSEPMLAVPAATRPPVGRTGAAAHAPTGASAVVASAAASQSDRFILCSTPVGLLKPSPTGHVRSARLQARNQPRFVAQARRVEGEEDRQVLKNGMKAAEIF